MPDPTPSAPLAGRTVVVTRPGRKAHTLADPLRSLGARVLVCPSIVIAPPADDGPLREARARTGEYDWVVVTSANGVRALLGEIARPGDGAVGGVDPGSSDDRPGGVARPRHVAVVGPATGDAVEERLGWRVDLVPEEYTGEGLLAAFDDTGIELAGARVLLPVAEAARDVLPGGLAERGARVDRVVAYRSVPPDGDSVERVAGALAREEVDLLTFTSPSTAENFLEAVGEAAFRVPAATIGPVTADACRDLGYRVAAVAEEHTVEGLLGAVVSYLTGEDAS